MPEALGANLKAYFGPPRNSNLIIRQICIDGGFESVRQASGPSQSGVVVLGRLQDGVERHEVGSRHGVLGQLKIEIADDEKLAPKLLRAAKLGFRYIYS